MCWTLSAPSPPVPTAIQELDAVFMAILNMGETEAEKYDLAREGSWAGMQHDSSRWEDNPPHVGQSQPHKTLLLRASGEHHVHREDGEHSAVHWTSRGR